MRLQPARAIGLHVIRKNRIEKQRDMAKQVVKNIGLDDVIQLNGRLWRYQG